MCKPDFVQWITQNNRFKPGLIFLLVVESLFSLFPSLLMASLWIYTCQLTIIMIPARKRIAWMNHIKHFRVHRLYMITLIEPKTESMAQIAAIFGLFPIYLTTIWVVYLSSAAVYCSCWMGISKLGESKQSHLPLLSLQQQVNYF